MPPGLVTDRFAVNCLPEFRGELRDALGGTITCGHFKASLSPRIEDACLPEVLIILSPPFYQFHTETD